MRDILELHRNASERNAFSRAKNAIVFTAALFLLVSADLYIERGRYVDALAVYGRITHSDDAIPYLYNATLLRPHSGAVWWFLIFSLQDATDRSLYLKYGYPKDTYADAVKYADAATMKNIQANPDMVRMLVGRPATADKSGK